MLPKSDSLFKLESPLKSFDFDFTKNPFLGYRCNCMRHWLQQTTDASILSSTYLLQTEAIMILLRFYWLRSRSVFFFVVHKFKYEKLYYKCKKNCRIVLVLLCLCNFHVKLVTKLDIYFIFSIS